MGKYIVIVYEGCISIEVPFNSKKDAVKYAYEIAKDGTKCEVHKINERAD